ncbi:MAG: cytochrome c oxidase subunit II [Aquificaceae bacterium]|nr:cytochrome c oxidase subunit II [Aquificaceae bacterium]MDW8237704.1 cytochrome c oxidase subunit II [Aquificaceae bacterium]
MKEILAQPANYFDIIYEIWLIVSVIIYLIVFIPGAYFLFKYRYRKGVNERGVPTKDSKALEAMWIIIPTIVVIYLATQSFAFYNAQRTPPEGALEIKVTAFMWGWEFEYPNGKQVYTFFNSVTDPQTGKYIKPEEVNDAVVPYIPAGKPVKVYCTSRDVIQSFYVHPAKVTEDCVPGRITHLWFQINKPGNYWVFCREYCGTQHSKMAAVLRVVPEEQFQKWVSEGVQPKQN